MPSLRTLLAASAGLLSLCAFNAHADEPLFGYVYTTDLLPKGKKELEQWATFREGRANGDFHVLQTRTEFSYGVTDRFQVSTYLNLADTNVYHNAPDGTTLPAEVFADYNADPDARFKATRLESISVEGIYRFLSPYTDGFGLAAYIEPSIGPRTYELETRIIGQKNFIDDKLVIAGNITIGQEKRYLHGDTTADPDSEDYVAHWDKETDVNFGLAATYRFAANWYAGGEWLNEREWAGFDPFDNSQRTNVAYYFGPTIHYGGEKFFVTATFLKQLKGAKDYAAETPEESAVIKGISNADDFENYRLRLKAGFYF
ncbi:MAG: hypothetical protein QM647_08065 [Asticcacaulis sp.]|uniref:DUF6662 family protein n=1 Tax=Asticcacaulis sp. TaxID=1872648 RepID=UPI0039E671A0